VIGRPSTPHRWRVPAVGLVLAAVGALSPAAGPPTPVVPPAPSTVTDGQLGAGVLRKGTRSAVLPEQDRAYARITALLDDRARAVRTRDEPAFLAGIDPAAPPAFRAAQRDLFRHLDGVPLAHWSYRLSTDDPAAIPPELGAEDLAAPQVQLRYALRGADPMPTERPMGYVFARRDGQWYLTSDTALADQGRPTWRGPWDFGPCRVVTTETGLVLGHPEDSDLLGEVGADLDPAVRAVSEALGTGWPQRVTVLLPGSAEELRETVGDRFATDSIAAVAVADRVDAAAGVALGQRVVLNPASVAQMSPMARRVVLRHEITHIATRVDTVDGAPMWILEGFADHVGYLHTGLTLEQAAPDLVRAVRRGGPPAGLPSVADFATAGPQRDLAYQAAWSAARYIADVHGQQALVTLFRRLAAHPEDPAATDAALRDVLGVDTADFVAGWQQDLRRTTS